MSETLEPKLKRTLTPCEIRMTDFLHGYGFQPQVGSSEVGPVLGWHSSGPELSDEDLAAMHQGMTEILGVTYTLSSI